MDLAHARPRTSNERLSRICLRLRNPGLTISRAAAAAVLDLTADWGDHYSLIATEMRLAGVLPPTAQRASR